MYITVSRSGKIYADMGQILNLRRGPGAMFPFGKREGVAWYNMSRSIVYFVIICGVVSTYVIDYPEVDTNSANFGQQLGECSSINPIDAEFRSTLSFRKACTTSLALMSLL